VCSSPRLLAAYHGLHRTVAPRHPPWTLSRLTIFSLDACSVLLRTLHAPLLPRSHAQACHGGHRIRWHLVIRDIRAPRSLALRLSGANGQTTTPPPRYSRGFSSSFFHPRVVKEHRNCSVRSPGSPLSDGSRPTLEVWGLEPQTYGLQSHRSSH
jgi:hypothetical protein